jgi:dihydrofolate synthase/folylpolyglutamate synthase
VNPPTQLETRNSKPATLAQWLEYLEQLHPQAIAMGLERVVKVRQALALAPSFPVLTVGGTNGKGSCCAMLEAMLLSAGYRVGCYTSPHLVRYNERVRICGTEVGDAVLCGAFERIEDARADTTLTYFEFGTLAAMQAFVDARVDVAIMEVGLGGRLDAVNAFDNRLCTGGEHRARPSRLSGHEPRDDRLRKGRDLSRRTPRYLCGPGPA